MSDIIILLLVIMLLVTISVTATHFFGLWVCLPIGAAYFLGIFHALAKELAA
jgi:hypothetical protein